MQRLDVLGMSLLLAIGFPAVAHAYVDPGTGSLLMQVLAAFAVAALYPIQRLIARWRSPQRSREAQEETGRQQG
jgi:hypothetical protein